MVLSNSQYDEIMRMYDARQSYSKHVLDNKTAHIYSTLPAYRDCYARISSLSVDAAKASMMGDTTKSGALKAQVNALKQDMDKILLEAGYPADYLTLEYECPVCKDTGFVNGRKCTCFTQAAIDLLYRQSGINRSKKGESFDDFSLDYYADDVLNPNTGVSAKDNARNILDACLNFVHNFPSGENILFYGYAGVGKTFLSNCIARELLNNSHSVLYVSAVELFDSFSSYNNNDYQDTGIKDALLDCELLIIDDLGTELSNSFTNSKLFQCLNTRLLEGKSTIISTNLSPEDLMAAYSDRIFSRISGSYELFHLMGEDIRLQQK